MIDTLQSLKHTINERIKNPFVGTFVLAWSAINWRPLSVYFMSKQDIQGKIAEINKNYSDWHCYLLWPLLVAIFYILVLPYLMAGFEFLASFSKIFREKNYSKVLVEELKSKNEILKQQVQNEKVLTEFKDRASINHEIQTLKSQIFEKDSQLESLNLNYNTITEDYKKQIETLRNKLNEQDKIFSDYKVIESDFIQLRKALEQEKEENSKFRLLFEDRAEKAQRNKEMQERTENDLRTLLRFFIQNKKESEYNSIISNEEINKIIHRYT